MKLFKIILVVNFLIGVIEQSSVSSMRACFKMCRSRTRQVSNSNKKNHDGFTQLHCALKDNDFDSARSLLLLGADPAITDEATKWTALHWAVFKGQDALVEIIMKKNSKLMYAADVHGKTPQMLVYERIAYMQSILEKNIIDRMTCDNDKKSTDRMIKIFSGGSKEERKQNSMEIVS